MQKEIDEYQDLEKRSRELRAKVLVGICSAMNEQNWDGIELTMKLAGDRPDIIWRIDEEAELKDA